MGQRRLEPDLANPDPLDVLELRIEAALGRLEAGDEVSWPDFEKILTEGYGRLLALEALRARLERQLDDGARGRADAERRELERFHGSMLTDAERLRRSLGRFKARGLDARRRSERSP